MKTWCWFTNTLSDTWWNWTPLRIFSLEFLAFLVHSFLFTLQIDVHATSNTHSSLLAKTQTLGEDHHLGEPFNTVLGADISHTDSKGEFSWISLPYVSKGLLFLLYHLVLCLVRTRHSEAGAYIPHEESVSAGCELTQTMPALHGLGHDLATSRLHSAIFCYSPEYSSFC